MRMPRARRGLVVLVLSTALLAACGSESTPPPPPPSMTSTVTTTTFTPPPGIPRVTDPLDGSAFEQDPCSSLTPAQRKQLKLDDGGRGHGTNAEQSDDNCTYEDLDPETALIVYVNYYLDEDWVGLTSRYDEHLGGQYPRWEPTTVDRYPAVIFHYNPAEPADCNLDVGISDATVFNVKVFYYGWKGWTGQDPCVQARTIASAVLTTIKAAD